MEFGQNYSLLMPILAVLCLHLSPAANSLIIGSFNVNTLGLNKIENQDVLKILVDIIHRYDIVLIQEIRDKSGKAIHKLLEKINEGEHVYDVELSGPLGRTSYPKQFAFLYRVDEEISVADVMHWDDVGDLFDRDPFIVRFEAPHCAMKDFVLVGLRLDPHDAEHELAALVEVRAALERIWFADNILFLGDLSADCDFFTDDARERSAVVADEDYFWWIADDQDTTVKGTNCAYDRFIMVGEEFIDSVDCQSAGVFRFDEELNVSRALALNVSDHYPIELELADCGVHDGYSTDEDTFRDEL